MTDIFAQNKSNQKSRLTEAYRWILRPQSAITIAVIMIVLGLVISIIFLARLGIRYSALFSDTFDFPATGQTGDFIGGVAGSLWALGGVLLLLATLVFQKREADANRELLLTQLFENTYLQLLRSLRELVMNSEAQMTIHFRSDGTVLSQFRKDKFSGFALFREMKTELHGLMRLWIRANNGPLDNPGELSLLNLYQLEVHSRTLFDHLTPETQEATVKVCYERFFDTQIDVLGHYFRYMFNIIKFVDWQKQLEIQQYQRKGDTTDSIGEDYQRYIDFIQAEMSSAELYLMFYNGLMFPKARDFVNKYKIIENLRVEDLPDERMAEFYPTIRFKRQSPRVINEESR